MPENGTLALWEKLKGMVKKEIDSRTRSCCRLKSMVVTTAYSTQTRTVGVTEAFGTEIQIPVMGAVDTSQLTVGTPVWVMVPFSSMSNAIVMMLGDGSGTSASEVPLATTTAPGIVQVGNGLNVNGGVLSVNAQWDGFLNQFFPVGSIYTTASPDISPANIIGGEWTLRDKVFANQILTSGFFTAGSGASASSTYAVIAGHTIRFRVTVSYNAALADSAVELGTLNWSQLGLTGGNSMTTYLTGISDSGNGLSLATIDSSTGVLTHTDCVTKISGGTIAANQSVTFCMTTNSIADRMLDRFCNQFIWVRTA